MNELFGKLGAAAKRAADTVSTSVNVAAEEQKIKEAYQALGKMYYQARRDGSEMDSLTVADHCRKIEESMKRIGQLKDKQDVAGDCTAEDDDFVTVE